MRRAIFNVTVAGTNISTALGPILLNLTVTDNAGTHSDTAAIEVDDTGGQIILPEHGAAVSISLGWDGEGLREVFSGTVDEFRSSGSKSTGRTLSISAKGVNTLGRAKEGQSRHFDNQTVADVLKAAGEYAGIGRIEVDPELAQIKLPYIDMRAESFLHLGERLAGLIGGNFRVQGQRATMARRNAGYSPTVTAQEGINLISWDLTPIIGRGRYKAAKARVYDRRKAKEVTVEEPSPTPDPGAQATITRKDLLADPDEARRAAKGAAATAAENAGGGTVEIDGNTEAVPDGQCVVVGARPGIDGTYTISSVTHTFSRGSGFTTSLQLCGPKGGAGKDSRATKASGKQTKAAANIDAILQQGKPQ